MISRPCESSCLLRWMACNPFKNVSKLHWMIFSFSSVISFSCYSVFTDFYCYSSCDKSVWITDRWKFFLLNIDNRNYNSVLVPTSSWRNSQTVRGRVVRGKITGVQFLGLSSRKWDESVLHKEANVLSALAWQIVPCSLAGGDNWTCWKCVTLPLHGIFFRDDLCIPRLASLNPRVVFVTTVSGLKDDERTNGAFIANPAMILHCRGEEAVC